MSSSDSISLLSSHHSRTACAETVGCPYFSLRKHCKKDCSFIFDGSFIIFCRIASRMAFVIWIPSENKFVHYKVLHFRRQTSGWITHTIRMFAFCLKQRDSRTVRVAQKIQITNLRNILLFCTCLLFNDKRFFALQQFPSSRIPSRSLCPSQLSRLLYVIRIRQLFARFGCYLFFFSVGVHRFRHRTRCHHRCH